MSNINKDPARRGSTLEDSKAHKQDHRKWSRRSFLRNMSIAGGSSVVLGGVPVFASGTSALGMALSNLTHERVLVLIRLKGGNDGLNTIIPLFDYDTYANFRPLLRIPEVQTFNLSDEIAMPNYMNALEPMWAEGRMKVIHSVGYPDQNLSHFRSSDIWASASDEDEVINSGWLGRYFNELYPDFLANPPEVPPAVQIGSIGNMTFLNPSSVNMAMSVINPVQLFEIAQTGLLYDVSNLPECVYGEQVGFVRAVANTTFTFAGAIKDAFEASSNSVDYGNSFIGEQLALVARLIKGNLGSRIYMVSLDGFDTHANQPGIHEALLASVANAVKNFFDDLASGGVAKDVLGMTFSEFGRRIEENASEGTDHGAAAPIMLFGEGLNGNGFSGTKPDLHNLDNVGNLVFGTDFRQVYASVMEHWLCINPAITDEVLGQNFERITDLGLTCQTTPVNEPDYIPAIEHKALYGDGQVSIQYLLPSPGKVKVGIFNVLGQPVQTLFDGYQLAGQHQVSFREQQSRIASGVYYYRIIANGRAYSKPIRLVHEIK